MKFYDRWSSTIIQTRQDEILQNIVLKNVGFEGIENKGKINNFIHNLNGKWENCR